MPGITNILLCYNALHSFVIYLNKQKMVGKISYAPKIPQHNMAYVDRIRPIAPTAKTKVMENENW